jgi:hydroxypyruvate reductase/glycerate 2-kinase
MSERTRLLRDHATTIWRAAVAAVDPLELVRAVLSDGRSELGAALAAARQILVLGGGKAGAAMARGVESALSDRLDRLSGLLNVPAESVLALQRIRLHAARPAGVNYPTPEGVAGAEAILSLAAAAGPHDVGLCLLSGGGSALLPAPAEGVTLADKQTVTHLLHACGASIDEMNCVRKHLSRMKGGRLAQAFSGRALFTLILSDVIGDPLDVIASGPTAADPTTFADALAVLERFGLTAKAPPAVLEHLRRGRDGGAPETLKHLPGHVHNLILGNNARALAAAERCATTLGYPVVNLGSFVDGDTTALAEFLAAIVRSIRRDGRPQGAPVCLLSGGETTVKLGADHGRGGRNQELVLALLQALDPQDLNATAILSGGSDGEDGPTDAAGAIADADTLSRARSLDLDPAAYLSRHDAYTFFNAVGDLFKTGLTGTNVMDVRVILFGGLHD